jgi:hypothetical protein
MRSTCIIGLVCLLSATAHASPEEPKTKSKHELLERRLLLPSLLGLGVGTPPLMIGSSAIGFATFPSGIVSYSGGETTNGSETSHYDAFAFNPSFDVRVGRFTIGGALSIGYTHQSLAGASDGSSTSFEIAPRIGYVIPLTGELYLWPRVSAGFLYAQASASRLPTSSVVGGLASADLLLVWGLGSHFFLTAGPSGWIDGAWETGLSSSSFGIGASVGLGVAL